MAPMAPPIASTRGTGEIGRRRAQVYAAFGAAAGRDFSRTRAIGGAPAWLSVRFAALHSGLQFSAFGIGSAIKHKLISRF